MTNIPNNLQQILNTLPKTVQLVAVSKYHPAEMIKEAYACGQRVFGESREQELNKKAEELPKDIQWHFIGHLQTNKVKFIAPYITMIETVDSLKLLREINKQAERCNRVIDTLLELHIAKEITKNGLSLNDCRKLLQQGEWRQLTHLRICGLMMMASHVDDKEQIRKEMLTAEKFFNELKSQYFSDAPWFKERSWGMSHDYLIATQCGSTLVRIGTKLFGERK